MTRIGYVYVDTMRAIDDLPMKKIRKLKSNEKMLSELTNFKDTLTSCHFRFKDGDMSSLVEFSSALQNIYSISRKLAKNSSIHTQDKTLNVLARLKANAKYVKKISQNANTTSQLIFDLGDLHGWYSRSYDGDDLKRFTLLYLEGENITEEFVNSVINEQRLLKHHYPKYPRPLNNSIKLLSRLEAQLLLEGS